MSKYIHLYDTENEFDEAYNGDGYLEPWVSYTKDIDRVDYNAHRTDYSKMPLTLEVLVADGGQYDFMLSVGSIKRNGTNYKPSYSINGGEWTDEYIAGSLISGLTAGDIIQFKGSGDTCSPSPSSPMFYGNNSRPFKYNVYGNVASLLYGDDFENADGTGLASGSCANIFRSSYGSSVVDASNLILPFTVLQKSTYGAMFQGATELVLPPSRLPAAVLPEMAYYNMFAGCTSLTKTPDMSIEGFTGTGACQYMFSGCTNLATTFKELPATALTMSCYSSMFMGCAALEKAPDILVENLSGAYTSLYGMFSGCTSLNYVKAMFVDLGGAPFSAYGYGWMDGVSQTGTFVKNVNAEWTESDVIPSGWTVETASS